MSENLWLRHRDDLVCCDVFVGSLLLSTMKETEMIDEILALLPKFEMRFTKEELATFKDPNTVAESMVLLYGAVSTVLATIEQLMDPAEKLQVVLHEYPKLQAIREAEKLTRQWLLEHIKL